MGVVKLDAPHAVIQFGDRQKLIRLAHSRLANDGSWSFFRCPRCDRRCNRLWSVDDAPRCCKCCEAMGIRHRSQYGFGRTERLGARDQYLDELIRRLETCVPLMLNGAPASWQGKAQFVYRSRRLTRRIRDLRLAEGPDGGSVARRRDGDAQVDADARGQAALGRAVSDQCSCGDRRVSSSLCCFPLAAPCRETTRMRGRQ